MNSLIWNLRGIGNTSTVFRLKQLIQRNNICLVAVFELMIDVGRLMNMCLQLGFDCACSNINSNIWIFWKDELQCSIVQNDEQCISVNCNHGLVDGDFFSFCCVR